MNSPPPRALLRELLRIADIATRFLPGFEPADVVRALRFEGATREPNFLERIRARISWTRVARAYGAVWTFERFPFFATEPIAFLAVQFPDGAPAILFDRSPRRDLQPYVVRLAVERLCRAHAWTFPGDFRRPSVADALWDLLWLACPKVELLEPLHAAFEQTESSPSGTVVVAVRWEFDGSPDRLVLSWDDDRLDIVTCRFDAAEAKQCLAMHARK